MNYIIKTNLKGGWQTIKFNDYDQYIQKWQQLKENGDIYENEKPIVRFNQKGGNGNIYFLIKFNEPNNEKIVGLHNRNNYCFVNSAIQLFYSIDYLRENLLNYQHKLPSIDLFNKLLKGKFDITKGITYEEYKSISQIVRDGQYFPTDDKIENIIKIKIKDIQKYKPENWDGEFNLISFINLIRINSLIIILQKMKEKNNTLSIKNDDNDKLKNVIASGVAIGWMAKMFIEPSDSIEIFNGLIPDILNLLNLNDIIKSSNKKTLAGIELSIENLDNDPFIKLDQEIETVNEETIQKYNSSTVIYKLNNDFKEDEEKKELKEKQFEYCNLTYDEIPNKSLKKEGYEICNIDCKIFDPEKDNYDKLFKENFVEMKKKNGKIIQRLDTWKYCVNASDTVEYNFDNTNFFMIFRVKDKYSPSKEISFTTNMNINSNFFILKSVSVGASVDEGHYTSVVYNSTDSYKLISDNNINQISNEFYKNDTYILKNWNILIYEKVIDTKK